MNCANGYQGLPTVESQTFEIKNNFQWKHLRYKWFILITETKKMNKYNTIITILCYTHEIFFLNIHCYTVTPLNLNDTLQRHWSFVEKKELSSGFLTAVGWLWRIKLKDLWLQGAGFDPWTRRRVNSIQGSEVKWHKAARSIMKHISEVYSSALIHFLPQAVKVRGDDVFGRSAVTVSLSLLVLRCFTLYFWTRLLNVFLIDCDPDQWLAVAGLLSQYRIYSVSLPRLQPALLPSSSATKGGLSMKLSSRSSVYTLQPFPDPVNVLSVSWHTCSLNNDPVVTSCTNKEPCPLPLNEL